MTGRCLLPAVREPLSLRYCVKSVLYAPPVSLSLTHRQNERKSEFEHPLRTHTQLSAVWHGPSNYNARDDVWWIPYTTVSNDNWIYVRFLFVCYLQLLSAPFNPTTARIVGKVTCPNCKLFLTESNKIESAQESFDNVLFVTLIE